VEQTRPVIPIRRVRVPKQRIPPGTGTAPVVSPGRRLRLALVVTGGVLALLCLGGTGVAFVLYADTTAPDRSTPQSTVRSYLSTYLVQRDDTAARLYTCARPALEALTAFRAQIAAREAELGVSIAVSSGTVVVASEADGVATATTLVYQRAIVRGKFQEISDPWRFEVVDEAGWRVCGAEPG